MKITRTFIKIFLALFFISVIINILSLALNFYNPYLGYTLLGFAFVFLFLIFRKQKAGFWFEFPKYVFLFLLLLVTLSSLKFNFINTIPWLKALVSFLVSHQLVLTIATIAIGALVFWMNKEIVEIDIEEEKEDEEKAEKKRYEEFDGKFKRLTFFNFKYNVVDSFREEKWIKGIFRILISPLVWIARLPYSLVKWMYKEGWAYSAGLIGIVVLGFVLRVFFALTTNYDLDEGMFLYESWEVTKGGIPFIDFPSRAPLMIYLISFIFKIFSSEMIVGKIFVILFSIINIILVFFIANKLFNKKVALIASVLYGFLPMNLYYSIVVHTHIMSLTFVLMATKLIIDFYYNGRNTYLFFSFFFLGLGYLVRRTSLIYISVLGIVYLYFHYKKREYNLKKISLQLILIGSGLIIGILPLLGFLIYKSSFFWINIAYGFNSLIRDTSISNVTNNYLSILFSKERLLTFAKFLMMNSIVILPGLYALLLCINRKYRNILGGVIILFSVNLIWVNYHSSISHNVIENFIPSSLYIYLIYICMFISLIFYIPKKKTIYKEQIFFITYWLMIIFFSYFFLIKDKFHLGYFFEILPGLCILAAIFFYSVFGNIKRKGIIVIICIFFFIMCTIHLFTLNPYSRHVNNEDLKLASDYLMNITSQDKLIFTADTTLAFLSKRNIVYSFTRYSIYPCGIEDPAPLERDPFDVVPSISKLIEGINNSVEVIADSGRTGALIHCQPKMDLFFKKEFTLDKCFNNICIYKKNP